MQIRYDGNVAGTTTPANALTASAPNSLPKPLLQVRTLKTYFRTEAGMAKAVDGVNFDIYEGEVLGLVGESGSGKTSRAAAIMRLVPANARERAGTIAGHETDETTQRGIWRHYREVMRYPRVTDFAQISSDPDVLAGLVVEGPAPAGTDDDRGGILGLGDDLRVPSANVPNEQLTEHRGIAACLHLLDHAAEIGPPRVGVSLVRVGDIEHRVPPF